MSTSGKRLLSSFLNGNHFEKYVRLRISDKLFREGEMDLFMMVNNHVMKFGKLPSLSTVEQYGLMDDVVDTDEPPEFYLQEVERRYLRDQLKQMLVSVTELLQEDEDEDAYTEVMNRMGDLVLDRNKNLLFDVREAWPIVKQSYNLAKLGGEEHVLKFGWPRLDRMTGGLGEGDMCSVVGRPATGKTFKLLYMARNSWKAGRKPLLVSLEMNAQIIMQRLSAMETQVNLTNLLKGQLSTASLTKLKNKMLAAKNSATPFWVVDGNLTSTVDDVIMLAKQLGSTDVYIDAAYLLKHKDKRISKWDRMSENAESIKKNLAQGCEIPVVASYQFSKDSKKKAKEKGTKADMGMEDIYGSDAIAQLSTVVLGLMEKDSIETQLQRLVKVLKGRNGETGQFPIHWDFNLMDFSQVLEAEDYEYLQEKEPPKQEGLSYID